MRCYFPEKPLFRFFRQKPDCQAVPLASPVAFDRAAPQPTDATKPSLGAPPPAAKATRPNEGAHRVLDQIEAVQSWWKAPLRSQPAANPKVAMTSVPLAPKEKPFEPYDLQDVPDTWQAQGYQLGPQLLRRWFANPAYAVASQAQKECQSSAPFYPDNLVDASMLKLSELMKTERIAQACDKIKSPEFLQSKAVQDSLRRLCTRLPEGYGYDVNPAKEFGGDLQKMHRRYAFASITVGSRFPQDFDDIRVQASDKSKLGADDVALALGEFRLWVAIEDAYVAYHGRTTRSVRIKELAIYIMAPFGFDTLTPGSPYMGHYNKKHLALVSDGDWAKTPVATGNDAHAKHALLRRVSRDLFLQWRDKHHRGGDMLLFSERRPSFPNMEVVVPLRPIAPRFALMGRIAADVVGQVFRVPHKPLHFTLAMFDTEWGTVCIDGQPTLLEAGTDNFKQIRSNFYYEQLPTKVVMEQSLEVPQGVTAEQLSQALYQAAQGFASYTEPYSAPIMFAGPRMWPTEYNSNSYLAGLLQTVLGHVPSLGLLAEDGTQYQAPGWETPMPTSYFKGEAIK